MFQTNIRRKKNCKLIETFEGKIKINRMKLTKLNRWAETETEKTQWYKFF